MDIFIQLAAVHDFLDDADLLFLLFVGITVVCINDAGRIFQIPFIIKSEKCVQILIVVVGDVASVFVGSAAQDGMCKLIAGGIDFPAPVNKGMGMLGGIYGIQHYGKITTGGILHSCRDIKTAHGKTVLLILYGTGTDSYISCLLYTSRCV